MRLLAVALAIPTALLAWQWWGDRSTEMQLAPIVTAIAGRNVAVDCQTLWGSLVDVLPRHGEVRFDANGVPEPRIFLTHATCDRLAAFAAADRHSELDCLRTVDWLRSVPLSPRDPCYERASPTLYALLTLAHEAYHTAGIKHEAAANCYATQALAYAVAALGASDDEARLVARGTAALLPLQRGEYQTSECVAGGPLDLRPETPAFPSEESLDPPQGLGGRPGLAAGA